MAAGSAKEAWRSSQRVEYIWQYLGLQDAPRKRRTEGKYGSPWRGTKVHIIYGYIYLLKGYGIWAKTRLIIKKWLQRVTSEEPLNYKELQSEQGMLNCVFESHWSCRPFLKGMDIILYFWCPHRDPEGWKQDPGGLGSDILEDNFVGDSEETLIQITGTPSEGGAAEKGQPNTVRSSQHWFYYKQVIK